MMEEEHVLDNVVLFLRPWEARNFMIASPLFAGRLRGKRLVDVDRINLRRKISRTGSVHRCRGSDIFNVCKTLASHRSARLKLPHDCNDPDSGCNGSGRYGIGSVCKRNDRGFGDVHWDSNSPACVPVKCTLCGLVFVDGFTCKKCFFLSDAEVRKLEVHLATRGRGFRPNRLYDIREVRWMSILRNRTHTPMFRYSAARCTRQRWLMGVKGKIAEINNRYSDIFDTDVLMASNVFQTFLTTSSKKKDLQGIVARMETVLPLFAECYASMDVTDALGLTLFPPMGSFSNRYWSDPVFYMSYKRSLEYCISIALSNESDAGVERALRTMRGFAFDELKRFNYNMQKYFEPSSTLHDSVRSAECRSKMTDYMEGRTTLLDLYVFSNETALKQNRKDTLFHYLHGKGVYPEAIDCDAIRSYIEEGAMHVAFEDVMKCVLEVHLRRFGDGGTCFVRRTASCS